MHLFHGGSIDIISGRVRPRWPEILLSSHSGVLVLATQFAVLQKEQTSDMTTVYAIGKNFFPGAIDTLQIWV